MRYFWNKNQTKFIQLEKVRNFEVQVNEEISKVIAWISDNETVDVGIFEDQEQAKTFLENLKTFSIGEKEND